MAAAAILDFYISKILLLESRRLRYITVLNLIKIGKSIAEIL